MYIGVGLVLLFGTLLSTGNAPPLAKIFVIQIVLGLFFFAGVYLYLLFLYYDLKFVKGLSINLSSSGCTVYMAWNAIRDYGRLQRYVLLQPEIGLLWVKIMYEYSKQMSDQGVKNAANSMYDELTRCYGTQLKINIVASSVSEVAKMTMDYISHHNIILNAFRLKNLPWEQKIITCLFVVDLFFIIKTWPFRYY